MTVWREVQKLSHLSNWSQFIRATSYLLKLSVFFSFFLWTKINHGRYYDYVKLSIKIFIRFSFSLKDVYLYYCLKEFSKNVYKVLFFLSSHYRYPFLFSAINNVLPYHEYDNALLESVGRIYSPLSIISSNFGWVCTK